MEKDDEELLIAVLANGYSRAPRKRALESWGLPFSEPALEEAMARIPDPLDFSTSQPLTADWLALCLDASWATIRTETDTRVDLALVVAVGIDREGQKEVLGFWPLAGRESTAFWGQGRQDLLARGVHRLPLFVTDDFRGLGEVLATLLPYAAHPLLRAAPGTESQGHALSPEG